MSKKFIIAALSAALLASCEKSQSDYVMPQNDVVSVEIELPACETKVAGAGGEEEKAVSSYQVFIYDSSTRMLEAYDTPSPASNIVNMICTTGPKEVVVLANAPDLSSVVSYDRLLSTKALLSDNEAGKLVMEGSSSVNLTAANNKVTVELKKIVSKVVLEKIETAFELPAYRSMDFILKEVYLINVAADNFYLSDSAVPSLWYNKLKNEEHLPDLLWTSLGNVNIRDSRIYETRHHFYCCPNSHTSDTFSAEWSPRPTRLVVVAELGGTTYYYPVAIKGGIEKNKEYYVSLKVIRPGAASPEEDMKKSAAVFTIDIKGWDGQVDVTETI